MSQSELEAKKTTNHQCQPWENVHKSNQGIAFGIGLIFSTLSGLICVPSRGAGSFLRRAAGNRA